MTLQQLIRKNIERGWDVFHWRQFDGFSWKTTKEILWVWAKDDATGEHYSLADILTNHEFAKCWFGEMKKTGFCVDVEPIKRCNFKQPGYQPYDCLIEERRLSVKDCTVYKLCLDKATGHLYHLQQLIILPPDQWVEYYWNGGRNG